MDKFETRIKESEKNYEPTSDFVDNTMQSIGSHKPRQRWNMKLTSMTLAGVLVVVALVVLVWPSQPTRKITQVASKSSTTPTNTTTTPSPVSKSTPLPTTSSSTSTTNKQATSSNANITSLENDLASINQSLSQENSDQSSSSAAINDIQHEITVPTS